MMIVFDLEVHKTNNLIFIYLKPDKSNSGEVVAFLVIPFTTPFYRAISIFTDNISHSIHYNITKYHDINLFDVHFLSIGIR